MSSRTTGPKTNAELQAAQRRRERMKGIIRKLVRIPEHRAEELDKIVRQWMEQHNDEGGRHD